MTVRTWNTATGAAIRSVNHGAAVTSAAISKDGTKIASGGTNMTIKIWNAADGVSIASLVGHTGPVFSMSFSTDASRIVSHSTDGIQVWNTSGLPLERFAVGDVAFQGVTFGTDNRTIVSTDAKNSIHLINMSLVNVIMGHEGAVSDIAFSIDGAQLVSGGVDKTIRLWTISDGKQIGAFAGPTDAITSLDLSTDGKLLFAGGVDKVVYVWPFTAAANAAPQISFTHPAAVRSVHANPDGTQVVTSGDDMIIRAWDVASGLELERISGHTASVLSVVLAADGKTIVSGSVDKTARISMLNALWVAKAAEGKVNSVSLSQDGLKIASVGDDKMLRIWESSTGQLLYESAAGSMPLSSVKIRADGAQVIAGSADMSVSVWPLSATGFGTVAKITTPAPVLSVEYSSDSTKLAVGGADSHLRVYDSTTLQLLENVTEVAAVSAMAFAPDGKTVITAGANNALIQPLSLIRLIAGHEGAVTGLAYTIDGAGLISGGADKTIRRWNLADGAQVGTFAGSTDSVTDLRISRDGKRLVSSNQDKMVRVWPIAVAATDVVAEATFEHPAAVRSVSPGVDGTRIATCGDDNIVRLWDLETGQLFERFAGHTMPVLDVALADDGKTLVSGSADKSAVIWNVSATRVAVAAEGKVNSVSLSTDGLMVATAGDDKVVRLWNTATGAMLFEVPAGEMPMSSVLLSGDKTQLIAGSADMSLYVWTLAVAGPGVVTKIPTGSPILDLSYNADFTRVVVSNADKHLRIYDPLTGRLLEDIMGTQSAAAVSFTADGLNLVSSSANQALVHQVSLIRLIAGHEGAVQAVNYTPDGVTLVSGGADKTVRLWNSVDGTEIRQFAGATDSVTDITVTSDGMHVVAGGLDKVVRIWKLIDAVALPTLTHPAAIRGVAVSGDGTRIATSGDDNVVRVWDFATTRELQRFTGHNSPVLGVAFAADNKTLVSGSADKSARIWTVAATKIIVADETRVGDVAFLPDGSLFATGGADMLVKLWDMEGAMVKQFAGAQSSVQRIDIRADATQLAAADIDGRLLLWNIADGALQHTIETGAVINQLAYSADNRKIALAGADNKLRVFDPVDGLPLLELTAAMPLTTVAFASSQSDIITGGEDKMVRRWAYASPTVLQEFSGHTGPVYSITTSPDGMMFASGSGDHTIRIWNVSDGTQVKQLTGHSGAVYAIHFNADGTQLISCGADSTIRLWDVTAGKEIRQFVLGDEIPMAPFYDVSFSPDSQMVAATGADKKIHLWTVASGKLIRSITGHADEVYHVQFNAAGTKILTCGHVGNVNVWNVSDGMQAFTSPLPSISYSATYIRGGTQVIATCADGNSYVIDLPLTAR